MKKVKKRFITNIIFNIIALISTALALVFCLYIYKLDMIPSKYLKIAFMVISGIYLILLLLTLPRKLKRRIKVICSIFFILNGLIFGYGIKYSDKTIETLDKISYDLSQKEDYELKVLSDSSIKSSDDLNSKKIGIFKNDSYNDVVKYLKKDVDCELIDYDDPVKFFEDLGEKEIDGVIASNTVYGLLEEDLSYMKLELKNVHTVAVPVKGKINEIVKVVDVTNTPFNVFIAGGDAFGSINKVMNTDVNMIVSVDPVNHKLLLTSIPRDYYVNLPGKGEKAYDKLTHAGYYGIQESIKAVEKLFNIEINHYIKVNFTTISEVVDAIGGVTIYNEKAFVTNDRNFRYSKGNIHLNGKEALWYARERRAFEDGDIKRVQNQQKVLEAVFAKITSSKTLINKYDKILDSVSKNLATSLDSKSINRLVKLQLSGMYKWTVENQNVVGTGANEYTYSFAKTPLYVMKKDQSSVDKCANKINEFLNKQ